MWVGFSPLKLAHKTLYLASVIMLIETKYTTLMLPKCGPKNTNVSNTYGTNWHIFLAYRPPMELLHGCDHFSHLSIELARDFFFMLLA